ncbi:transcriptional regulator domain protein [Pseudarthrobacter siccitolerans]|uniref:Transcriptional regulator domain protein n=1 Tax=Pseudarthrobacter siccitolerans TaxID=861266 RepID=A0A024GZX4_9MICC|nr:hypothetical protein [Pseudarthrobacter siccitolerans]CCQ45049.1 transcriptional regulator domain protein [Pseudarthrobacter siccitolerans]
MESSQALAAAPVDGAGAGPSMTAAAELFKAVAHPVRAQVLELLSQGASSIPELCEDGGEGFAPVPAPEPNARAAPDPMPLDRGRLVYSLAYPQVTELLAAARSVLQAHTAAAASSLGTPPDEQPFTTLWGERYSAREAALVSRSVIADA